MSLIGEDEAIVNAKRDYAVELKRMGKDIYKDISKAELEVVSMKMRENF